MPMYCKYAFSFVGYNFNSFVLLFLGFIIFSKKSRYICHFRPSEQFALKQTFSSNDLLIIQLFS